MDQQQQQLQSSCAALPAAAADLRRSNPQLPTADSLLAASPVCSGGGAGAETAASSSSSSPSQLPAQESWLSTAPEDSTGDTSGMRRTASTMSARTAADAAAAGNSSISTAPHSNSQAPDASSSSSSHSHSQHQHQHHHQPGHAQASCSKCAAVGGQLHVQGCAAPHLKARSALARATTSRLGPYWQPAVLLSGAAAAWQPTHNHTSSKACRARDARRKQSQIAAAVAAAAGAAATAAAAAYVASGTQPCFPCMALPQPAPAGVFALPFGPPCAPQQQHQQHLPEAHMHVPLAAPLHPPGLTPVPPGMQSGSVVQLVAAGLPPVAAAAASTAAQRQSNYHQHQQAHQQHQPLPLGAPPIHQHAGSSQEQQQWQQAHMQHEAGVSAASGSNSGAVSSVQPGVPQQDPHWQPQPAGTPSAQPAGTPSGAPMADMQVLMTDPRYHQLTVLLLEQLQRQQQQQAASPAAACEDACSGAGSTTEAGDTPAGGGHMQSESAAVCPEPTAVAGNSSAAAAAAAGATEAAGATLMASQPQASEDSDSASHQQQTAFVSPQQAAETSHSAPQPASSSSSKGPDSSSCPDQCCGRCGLAGHATAHCRRLCGACGLRQGHALGCPCLFCVTCCRLGHTWEDCGLVQRAQSHVLTGLAPAAAAAASASANSSSSSSTTRPVDLARRIANPDAAEAAAGSAPSVAADAATVAAAAVPPRAPASRPSPAAAATQPHGAAALAAINAFAQQLPLLPVASASHAILAIGAAGCAPHCHVAISNASSISVSRTGHARRQQQQYTRAWQYGAAGKRAEFERLLSRAAAEFAANGGGGRGNSSSTSSTSSSRGGSGSSAPQQAADAAGHHVADAAQAEAEEADSVVWVSAVLPSRKAGPAQVACSSGSKEPSSDSCLHDVPVLQDECQEAAAGVLDPTAPAASDKDASKFWEAARPVMDLLCKHCPSLAVQLVQHPAKLSGLMQLPQAQLLRVLQEEPRPEEVLELACAFSAQ